MKTVFQFVLMVLVIGSCAMAQDNVVTFESVDLASTLDGAAYFLSLGPSVKAEAESEFGVIEGARSLRVTLFQKEKSIWIWVESIFYTRGGTSKVEWCAAVHERKLRDVIQGPGSYSPESFSWVNATTFQFYDDAQAIDPESFELVEKPRRLVFRHVENGQFEITVIADG